MYDLQNNYKKFLLETLKFFPNAKIYSAKRHELHIRSTNVSIEKAHLFFKNTIGVLVHSTLDLRYSQAYLTHFISFNNVIVPVVLSCGEYKNNKKDSITQKQLTPKKLHIYGRYSNIDKLMEDIKDSIFRLNPQLSSHWKSSDKQELSKLLVKLAYKIIDPTITFTEREQQLIKVHKASLGKDYGEILTSLYILKKHGNVDIVESESSASFDLSFTDQYGIINKFNTKSGNGSGQSFKSIKREISILSLDNYQEKSLSHVCLNIINSLICDGPANGKERIFHMAKEAQKISQNEMLGIILNSFSIKYFNGLEINKSNYQPPKDFNTYSSYLKSIWEEHNLIKIGLPKGNKTETADVFYENVKEGKENAILFTLATIIAHYFPTLVITNIMEKLVQNKVSIVHLNFNNDGVSFSKPEKVTYKFHYWGSLKYPANNWPGFKTVYTK